MTRLLTHLGAFVLVAAAQLSGLLSSLDYAIEDLAFKATSRAASGNIVVVEIDTRSLAQLDTWPWPRRYHAAVIDRLFASGARQVALDIDFGSRSNVEDDQILSETLARYPGRVVLPVFKQRFSRTGEATEIVHSEPNAMFARSARLGSVTIRLDADGRVRRYMTADDWRGRTINSMAGQLFSETPLPEGAFYVDYAILPDTIPRLSYTDVLAGNFFVDTVAGKTVIVGATAVELGDQVVVPIHRVLPGPVLQAMAYESLAQGRALQALSPFVSLTIALIMTIALGIWLPRWSWRLGLAVSVAAVGAGIALPIIVQATWPVIVEAGPMVAMPVLSYTLNLWRKLDDQNLSLFQHRLDAMHRRAMMQSVVDGSSDGIAIVDQDGVIDLFNPAAARITGIPAERATGQPIHTFLPWTRDVEALYERSSDATSPAPGANTVGPLELSIRTADGRECVLELFVSASMLSIQKAAANRSPERRQVVIYTFRDITERKQLEEAQRVARERAESANRAKTEFLANMSHELRTPLNAIIGFSEIMKMQAFGPIGSPHYLDYSTDIHNSGSHLLQIINDILDMSKIEAGELKPAEEEFDIADSVNSVMRLISERARKGDVNVTADLPEDLPKILADERMIKQILINLLTNAVKFTPRGGTVKLSARADSTGFLFMVADTGIGIPADKMDVILQPFGQADMSMEREYEGTGLGLPLVKSMTELHGGRLTIDSTVGQGTTAAVWFPRERIVAQSKEMTA